MHTAYSPHTCISVVSPGKSLPNRTSVSAWSSSLRSNRRLRAALFLVRSIKCRAYTGGKHAIDKSFNRHGESLIAIGLSTRTASSAATYSSFFCRIRGTFLCATVPPESRAILGRVGERIDGSPPGLIAEGASNGCSCNGVFNA